MTEQNKTINNPSSNPAKGMPRLLQKAAVTSVVIGAAGTGLMMLQAGRHSSRLLLVLFIGWVLLPFVALAWANAAAQVWSRLIRKVINYLTLVISLATLAIYGTVIFPLTGSPRAPVFLAVPSVSMVLIASVILTAVFLSRREK